MRASARKMAKTALDIGWDGNLPVSPAKIAQKLRIQRALEDGTKVLYPIFIQGKTSAELEGASGRAQVATTPDGQTAFLCEYNIDEVSYRSRFTIAHELGHVLLGHVKHGCKPLRDTSFPSHSLDVNEIAANNFAAELLMPENMVRHYFKAKPPLGKIAEVFGVSEAAMMYRLKNLGLY